MNNADELSLILQEASLLKNLSPALQSSLTELSNEANAEVRDIATDFKLHHDKLVICSTKVSTASDQSEVVVAELTDCLTSAEESFKRHQDKTRKLETNIQAQIGSCRIELKESEKNIKEKKLHQEKYEHEIRILKDEITKCEKEAQDKEDDARRLKEDATNCETQRNVHIGAGVLGTGLFVAGSLLTGGALAAAYTGAAVVNAAVNTGGTVICQEKISDLEDKAREKRRLAVDATWEKRRKECELKDLEKEIEDLKRNIKELTQIIEMLEDVDKLLCGGDIEVDEFIKVVGDLSGAVNIAKKETDIIKLIRTAFAKDPVKAQKMDVQKHMDNFKEKWEALESMLGSMALAETSGQDRH